MIEDTEQLKIFKQSILCPVVQKHKKTNQKLCGFMAQKGNHYNHELMVVGRAVNRWGEGKSTIELEDPKAQQEFIKQISYPNNHCQMVWVSESAGNEGTYNTNRSAFWRVVRKTSAHFGSLDRNDRSSWSSRLVWSNLYKIAPASGGNPSNSLCAIQEEGCIKLLQQEIAEFAPKRILFLTGWNWAGPFVDKVAADYSRGTDLVEAYGYLASTNQTGAPQLVVAQHPQCKPEANWVEQVIAAFERLAC